jgi:hypothetical protein
MKSKQKSRSDLQNLFFYKDLIQIWLLLIYLHDDLMLDEVGAELDGIEEVKIAVLWIGSIRS